MNKMNIESTTHIFIYFKYYIILYFHKNLYVFSFMSVLFLINHNLTISNQSIVSQIIKEKEVSYYLRKKSVYSYVNL